jgi:cytochrome c-type biogenesis protein CcmH/NrfG
MTSTAAALGATLLMLVACGSLRSPPPFQQPPAPEAGTARPAPEVATPGQTPPAPARPPPKQYHLGAASTALVAQAHKQLTGGDFGLAAATVERAMRIEPDNPLLWIELGRVRYTAGDASQAESMGRKGLVLAAGDPQTQSSAWHLIADSLRSLQRNQEAADADKHANALSPH